MDQRLGRPRLIHLNGPPGVGKSTVAALWVERHPGALNLDIDSMLRLVGGWQDPERDTHLLLRPSVRAMAGAHLVGGHDVVVPQYLARIEEIDAFARVARQADADFVEVVLMVDRAEALDRFDQRPDVSDWHSHNRRLVAAQGGRDFLGVMYDRLLEVVRTRPSAVPVHAGSGVEETYAAVESAVRRHREPGGGQDP